jgi:hypothetical protein
MVIVGFVQYDLREIERVKHVEDNYFIINLYIMKAKTFKDLEKTTKDAKDINVPTISEDEEVTDVCETPPQDL